MASTDITSFSTSLTLSFWRRCDNSNCCWPCSYPSRSRKQGGQEEVWRKIYPSHVLWGLWRGEKVDTQRCVLTLQRGEVHDTWVRGNLTVVRLFANTWAVPPFQRFVSYRVLVGRLEGNSPIGIPRSRRKDNIKRDIKEMGRGHVLD